MFATSLRYVFDILTDSSSVCVVKCDAPGPAKDPGDEMTTSTDAVDNVKKVPSFKLGGGISRQSAASKEENVGADDHPTADRGRRSKTTRHNVNSMKKSSKRDDGKRRSAREPVRIAPERLATEAEEQRSLRDVVSSFAVDAADDDQRARDLFIINNAIESNVNYLSRCCLRNDLMSLGVLEGITFVANSKHSGIRRELHRLVQSEAKDLVIQDPPKDSQDCRSAIDLLFEWFNESKDSEQLLRKVILLFFV
ncbi:unnamed protein product [Nippostrongylus brasiliensis]|uniref:Death domain-containing protein n=1 Tax=Nippostrongylus brasiliensis TaxID=27835 RepID=A0A0N4YA31_NIPBR|nr:unnamed protein product [Nippostrongylus brasiliensis]